MDYVHINPVKHKLVVRVADWPYSTFHRLVEDGFFPLIGVVAYRRMDWHIRSENIRRVTTRPTSVVTRRMFNPGG